MEGDDLEFPILQTLSPKFWNYWGATMAGVGGTGGVKPRVLNVLGTHFIN